MKNIYTIAISCMLLLVAGSAVQAQGLNSFRISTMGADGTTNIDAFEPDVVYNDEEEEFLVVWSGDNDTLPSEDDIYGQRIDAITGAFIGGRIRISDMGPSENTSFDAFDPKVAWNSEENEYLVVWSGDDDTGALINGENEIWGQRLDAQGNEIGADDFRISFMGVDGDGGSDAFDPGVAYNSTDNLYMVVWSADDTVGSEDEIYAQVIDSAGALSGSVIRVSNLGPNGSSAYDADRPVIAYNEIENEFMIAFRGDDNTPPLVDGENEIFIRRYSGLGVALDTVRAISDMGPVGNNGFDADNAAIAFNVDDNEYLVVWEADDSVADDFNIYGQLLNAQGQEIGPNDFLISNAAPENSTNADTEEPAVVYNFECTEYIVVFETDNDTNGTVQGERDIYFQRVDGQGNLLGSDTMVTSAGPVGSNSFDSGSPAVAFNWLNGEYLIVNHGEDTVGSLADGENEIYGAFVTGCCLPPSIDCPASIVTTPNTLDCNPSVTWPAPTVFDGCFNNTITGTAMSGDNFPVGTTQVFLTVTDSLGGDDSCGFSVTVLQPVITGGITINGDTLCASIANATYQWFLNGAPINGATMQCYTALATGDYSVEITDSSGCTGITDTSNVVVALQEELTNIPAIFPNPTASELKVRFEQLPLGEVSITVNDLTGKTLLTRSSEGLMEWSLNLSDFSNGIYLIKVQTEEGQLVRKIQVQH